VQLAQALQHASELIDLRGRTEAVAKCCRIQRQLFVAGEALSPWVTVRQWKWFLAAGPTIDEHRQIVILGADRPAIQPNGTQYLLGSLPEVIGSEHRRGLLQKPCRCVQIQRSGIQALSNWLLRSVVTNCWARRRRTTTMMTGVQVVTDAGRQAMPKLAELVTEPLQQLWAQLLTRAPTVGSALAVLLALWVVARIARKLSERVLRAVKVDSALETTFVGRMLAGASNGLTPSKALASLVYAAILLLALAGAAEQLGLTAVRTAIAAVLAYLPRIGSGLVTLGIGGYVAGAAGRAVGSTLKELKSPFAGMAQSATETVVLLVTVTVAVDALGADLSFITSNLVLIFGVIAVTTAFLFCWSMRRPAEEVIANYYLRRLVRVGDWITLGEVQGSVEKFSALGVLLRDEAGTEHFVPARHLLNGLRREPDPDAAPPKA
jgi:Conserved TM helix/Mechanosensitive ion channel